MWPLVLRCLAVYGGTVAAVLFLAHRYVTPVRLRAAFLLASAPLLFTGKAILSGGVLAPLDIAYQAEPLRALKPEFAIHRTVNPLLVDVVSQMLPWRKAVREAIEAGRFPLWNRYILAGEPLLAVQQPAVFHPATWVGMLLPLPQAWTLEVTLRLFLALLCAYLFFRGTGAGETAAMLGACAWGFSDFLLFFVGYPVTSSVAPFPLLLLGLVRLVEDADRRAAGLTVTALVLTVVAGHPETLLFSVTGGGIFFLLELARAGRGRRLRPILLSLAAGALAMGLTAVVLAPFLEILPQTWQHTLRVLTYAKGRRSEPLLESLRRLVPTLVPYAYGALGRSQVVGRLAVPAGYAGLLLLPFASAGLSARSSRRWTFLALGLLGIVVHIRLVGVADFVFRLPLFDIAVNDYFIFFAVFALAALAVEGAGRLGRGEGVPQFVAGGVAGVLAVVLVLAVRSGKLRDLGMDAGYLQARQLMQILPVLFALVLVVVLARGRRLSTRAVALLAVLFVAQRGLEEAEVYPTYPARAFYPPLSLLDPIPRGEPVRMAALGYTFAPNIGVMYGLEDVRGYEAMVFQPLAETFGLWCVQQASYYNRVDDPTSPFLAFLNVRYVIAPPGFPPPADWNVLAEEGGSRLLENPQALPRAFAPHYLVWTDDPAIQMQALGQIYDFARDGVAGAARSGPLGWRENGEAEVKIVSYAAGRMALSVGARSPALVGTSVPAWKGWKLTLDGKRAPLLNFNHAFLGFEVPAGRHEAVLGYLPDGFVYGSAISLATLLVCVALLLRPPRSARM